MTIDPHETGSLVLLGDARRGFSGTVHALKGDNAESSSGGTKSTNAGTEPDSKSIAESDAESKSRTNR